MNLIRWTEREDSVLINEIQESPNNLTAAFRRAANKLERTIDGCRTRWYDHLIDGSPIISISSPKGTVINRKNTAVTGNSRGWESSEAVRVDNLSRDERVRVISETISSFVNSN